MILRPHNYDELMQIAPLLQAVGIEPSTSVQYIAWDRRLVAGIEDGYVHAVLISGPVPRAWLKEIIKVAFQELGLLVLRARMHISNIRSLRFSERLGFEHEREDGEYLVLALSLSNWERTQWAN